MRIGELGRRTGLPTATIRYYESERLLDARHVERGENNYRDYSPDTVQHLELIRQAQSAGFSLAEFRTLEEACMGSAPEGAKPEELLRAKIAVVRTRLVELERVQQFLIERLREFEQTAVAESGGRPARTPSDRARSPVLLSTRAVRPASSGRR